MALFGKKDVERLDSALRTVFGSIECYNPDESRNPPIAGADKISAEVDNAVLLGQKLKADAARGCLDDASDWQVARKQKRYFTGGGGKTVEQARAAAEEAAKTDPDDPLWPVRQKRWDDTLTTVRERLGLAVD